MRIKKESKRSRRMRSAGRYYLDRRICPRCGADVYRPNRNDFQSCPTCTYIFLWNIQPVVVPPQPPPRGNEPVLSTIQEGEEPEAIHLTASNDMRGEDEQDPLSEQAVSSTLSNAMATVEADNKTEARGDSVVEPLGHQAPGHNNNEQGQHPANPNSQTTPLPSTPSSPPQPGRRRLHRRPTHRLPRSPTEPTPSVITAHAIRLPRAELLFHRSRLCHMLKAAMSRPARHGRDVLLSSSPVIEPRRGETEGVLRQHCADLHWALVRVDGAVVDSEEEEEEEKDSLHTGQSDRVEESEHVGDSPTDECAPLLQPQYVPGHDGNEVAVCSEKKNEKKKSLRSSVRKCACFRVMRALGARLRNKTGMLRG